MGKNESLAFVDFDVFQGWCIDYIDYLGADINVMDLSLSLDGKVIGVGMEGSERLSFDFLTWVIRYRGVVNQRLVIWLKSLEVIYSDFHLGITDENFKEDAFFFSGFGEVLVYVKSFNSKIEMSCLYNLNFLCGVFTIRGYDFMFFYRIIMDDIVKSNGSVFKDRDFILAIRESVLKEINLGSIAYDYFWDMEFCYWKDKNKKLSLRGFFFKELLLFIDLFFSLAISQDIKGCSIVRCKDFYWFKSRFDKLLLDEAFLKQLGFVIL